MIADSSEAQDALFQQWQHEMQGRDLAVLAALTLIVSYAWLLLTFFARESFGPDFVSPASLLIASVYSIVSRKSHPQIASAVQILASDWVVFRLLASYSVAALPYLIVPIVLYSGQILRPLYHYLNCILLAFVLVLCGPVAYANRPLTPSMLAPMLILFAVMLITWLSNRNQRASLRWALSAYRQARHVASVAQGRQAQLAQALKSLDESAYRLQHINSELAKARDAAEELQQLKQEFVARVSHELRTPLAMIIGFSELMYMSPESYTEELPHDYLSDVREIYRNSQHLVTLIDDVLDLSKINVGAMQLRRQVQSVGAVAREATEMIRPLVEGKGLKLTADVPEHLPPAPIDATRIRQVLLNLLNNARRFTERGQISLAIQPIDAQIMVSVSDTGVGISLADQQTIFEQFSQINGSHSREHDGFGLGLAVSRELVEMHGGRIWVESDGQRDHGSTFRFTIPVQGPNQSTETLVSLGRRTHTGPRPKLLSVGNDHDVQSLLAHRLDNYEIISVDYPDALPELVHRFAPLAVLVQAVRGEEMDQIEAMGNSLSQYGVPTILCALGAERQLAEALDVQAYLVKPVQRDSLLRTLAELSDKIETVLVVDDDPRVVQLLSRMLTSGEQPYEVTRAYNGRQALQILQTRCVDAVVLDLVMPEMSGDSFLGILRCREALRTLPVVVVTARGYDIEDSYALSSGMVAMVHHRGLGNEETLVYVESLLQALESGKAFVGPAAS